jgi:glycosyltransferase involved in cell wall biosynthesis
MADGELMKIIEIGSVPPPYGGVAVHLQRLLANLRRRGKPHLLFDIGGISKNVEQVICAPWRRVVLRLLWEPRAIVHFHNFSPRNLIVFWLLGLRHTTVLSLHNERFADELNSAACPLRWIWVWMLNKLDVIIVISDKCRGLLAPLITDPAKIVVLSAFIAPPTSDTAEVPAEILALRGRCRFLIASNAYQLRFHRGVDLYGLDLFVELAGILIQQEKMDIGLVFLLPSIGDETYLKKIRLRIHELKVGDSCLIVTDPVEGGWAVWKASDLVIRATNTDGDSLTVKEALWCGTPVIASDCVPRDSEVITFQTRNLQDLAEKTAQVLQNLPAYRSRLKNLQFGGNADKLIHIYEELQKRGAR